MLFGALWGTCGFFEDRGVGFGITDGSAGVRYG